MSGIKATRVVKFIRKGDKGSDAVRYWLIPSVSTVVLSNIADGDGTPSPKTVSCRLVKQIGDDSPTTITTPSSVGLTMSYSTVRNNIVSPKTLYTSGSISVPTNTAYTAIEFYLYQGSTLIDTATIAITRDGEQGDRGPALRGPQAWSDCATGYSFQAGGTGEAWKDVVLYGDNYYSCIKSHTKTASNYPGSTTDQNNKYWQLGDKIELVATKILLATYALVKNLGVECIDMKDAKGNVLFQAKDGNVTCKTGNFDGITVNNAKIQSGEIAGFKISGNGLTNDPFTNDAYVIFRNDAHKCFAGIGGNVLPVTSGARAVARFENNDTLDQWGLGRNIALLLSAENGGYNHAFLGAGNGTLNGMIAGHRFSKFTCTVANTIYNGYVTLKENNYWIINSSVSGSGITLPKLTEVRRALDISDSTPFCVLFTVLADLNTSNFYIYGRNKLQDGNKKTPWNDTDLPLIVHWNNNYNDRLELGAGDSQTFLLIYDPSKTSGAMNGYGLTYTARRINEQS